MVEDSLVSFRISTPAFTLYKLLLSVIRLNAPVKVPAYDTPLPFFWVKEPFLESSVSLLKS